MPGASYREVPVDEIRPNAKQPRQVFDEDAQEELKTSIKEFGLLQPVVVRETGPGSYELVMGERRWRAGRDLGLPTIPAIVRDTADDAMLRDALLENLHRVQLNPLEEAAAYRQLLEEFGTTHEELANRIGRSRSQVTNTIRLLNLPVPVQRRVAAGVLSAGHARALLTLDDAEAQDALATRIVAEGLSVRAVEELVALAGHEKPSASRPAPARRVSAPALTDLADRLSDNFDTRVKVELGRRKGKIVVEFASVDDLERIVGLMVPGMSPRTGSTGGVSRDLVALPKAHLHVHLESTLRPATLASLGGAPPPAVFAGFGAFADYNAAVRACLRTAADFERVAYEFCVDSAADGVRYAEVTVTAAAHGARLGSGSAVLDGVLAGLRAGSAAAGIETRVVIDHSRRRPLPWAEESVRLAADRPDAVVGFGVAGDEAAPLSPYRAVVERAAVGGRASGAPRRGDRGCGERAGGARRRPGRADRARDPIAGGS